MYLSRNENAIEIIKENPHKFHSSYNENAIDIIKENLEKINWMRLSANINAIEILEKNKKYIYFNSYTFLSNPSIFTYDYELISEKFGDLRKEIVTKTTNRFNKTVKL
jgi:hypothetical protein